ncbi:MAG: 30S ribosomal protein S3ae [Candidatus Hydrothermarchaeota archaeon]
MAKRKRVSRKAKDTWKAKKWYKIISPETFGSTPIGETPSDDPSKLIGRVVEVTLHELTGDFSKSYVKLRFEINEVRGDKAYTKFIGHSLARDYIRSLVRRGSSKVEGITDVFTKDQYKIRVKGLVFTTRRTKTSQERLIRKKMFETVEKIAQERPFKQFVQEVVLGKLSADVYKAALKAYSLRSVEIRETEVLAEPA